MAKARIFGFVVLIGFILVSHSYALDLHLPWIQGTAYRCTQENEDYSEDASHKYSQTLYALDFGLSTGVIVRAAESGTAYTYEGYNSGFGNMIKIDHGNNQYTLYSHLLRFLVSNGQNVSLGDEIALSGGDQGYPGEGDSSGPHLHFGLHSGDASVSSVGNSIPSQILVAPKTGIGPVFKMDSGDFLAGQYYKSAMPNPVPSSCIELSSVTMLCWDHYYDSTCVNGSNWTFIDFEKGTYLRTDQTICPDFYEEEITDGPGGIGGGGTTAATDPPDAGEPDFIVTRMWLETVGGTEQYTYDVGQEIKMKAQFKNDGDADSASDIEVRFYLSKGYKEDAHSDWVHVGTDQIQESNMDVGDTHTETEGLITPSEPGKMYNIVACADTQDQVTEKHESNNCSTEAVFQINGKFDFTVISAVLGGGKTSLTVNEAYSVDTVVKNLLNDAPRDTKVGYYISGGDIATPVLIGTDSIQEENFTSGISKSETFTTAYAPISEGTYTIQVCADYDDRVQESNESNNCYSFDVFVDDPNLAGDSAEGTGQSPNYMSDAVKEIIMED